MRILIVASLLLMTSLLAAQERVLVFSRTTGFRHDSIPQAIDAMRALASAEQLAVDATEETFSFNDQALGRYSAVVFLLTTGDVLSDQEKASLQRYVESGGGFIGIHSAADTEHGWPWYGDLIGGWYVVHPAVQEGRLLSEDSAAFGSTNSSLQRIDEWYDFDRRMRGKVHVIASVDSASLDGSITNGDHPISWCHDVALGRSWYTAMGHTKESYSEPFFLAHLRVGLRYAAKKQALDCVSRNGAGEGVTLQTFDEGALIGVQVVREIRIKQTSASAYRWSGTLLPKYDGKTTFRFSGSGLVRFTLDGQMRGTWQLFDETASVAVSLVAGQRTPMVIELTPSDAGGSFEVRWVPGPEPEELLAAPQLYPMRGRGVRPVP